jgi:hypothetical protein
MKIVALFALLPILAGCATVSSVPRSPAAAFFQNLTSLCGKSFGGKLVAGDATDADFAKAVLQAHVGECSEKEVRIAFDVGDDRSRTWIISAQGEGLRLKHRHMLKNGSEDPLSQYGGDTQAYGTANRQEFPADDYSKQMFRSEGRLASVDNIWAFELKPDDTLVYELSRPNRLFRVEFDVSKPLAKSK